MSDSQPDHNRDRNGDDTQVCYRCLVDGRVQGVWFRGATREQALRLGVCGHARNLDDGRVEVLACGSPHAVAALRAWLHAGPPMARVERVDCTRVTEHPSPGFRTH